MKNKKLIRITTVPRSLSGLLQGQLRFMSDYYTVIGISSKEGDTLDKKVTQQEGVETIAVEMTRKITPFQDLKAVYQLYKIFKKQKPDIVHSHTPKAGTVSMMAAKLARVPHRLHTIAGLPLLEATGIKRKLLNTVEKLTYSCSTMIYPNSFGLKKIILDHKFTTPSKLKVIGNGSSNGIDTNHFDPNLYSESFKNNLREELGIKNTDLVFVFVGRIVADKGVNELIEAFKRIHTKYSDTKLLLVGTYEKELDPILPKTEEEINTNPNIITTGWEDDVRPYFSIAQVLTFPSYREGFPNVVMQAGAMGIPSIVTDINGCNEIITTNRNGIIIPVKNIDELYASMLRFIEDKQLLSSLAINARTMIQQNYERTFVWNALLEEYKTI